MKQFTRRGSVAALGRRAIVEAVEARRLLSSSVSGTIYSDVDGDGFHGYAEPPLANFQVFNDANHNAAYDAGEQLATTDANGRFTFDNIADTASNDIFTVVPRPAFGQVNTGPSSWGFVIPAYDEHWNTADMFSFSPQSVIRGSVSNDVNGNGRLDPNEYGLSGQVVYIDANENGVRDPGEEFTVTDFSGVYRLGVNTNPATGGAGAATVEVRLDAGSDIPAEPAGGLGVHVSYGYEAVGPVFRVVAPDLYSGEAMSSSYTNYNKEAENSYLEPGTTRVFTAYADSSNFSGTIQWDAHYAPGRAFDAEATGSTYAFSDDPAAYGPTGPVLLAWRSIGSDGVVSAIHSIKIDRPDNATSAISGLTFNDVNGNGVNDGEQRGQGKTIYLDTNNNGKPDAGETSMVTGVDGRFGFAGLAAGTYHVRRVFPTGYVQSTPPLDVTVGIAQSISGLEIGSKAVATPVTGSISGYVYDDKNGNGLYDAGEARPSGRVVFLDANNNGKLDGNEKSTTTATGGAFGFSGLPAGAYHVRELLPVGYALSTPALNLTLTAGAVVSNVSIGAKPVTAVGTASLAGTAFVDNNKNAKYDTGDGIGKSVTVFLDTDNDGVLDAGELSTVTDDHGKFTFRNLAVGTYHVRRVFSSGQTYSTPKIDLTLTSGQAKTGLVIGMKKT